MTPAAEDVFSQLMQVIAARRQASSEQSYTAQLLAAGPEKIGKKLVEEAFEATLAALETGPAGQEHLVREAADVIYHLWVLLAARQLELEPVAQELQRRFGTSGLAEKAARGNRPTSDAP